MLTEVAALRVRPGNPVPKHPGLIAGPLQRSRRTMGRHEGTPAAGGERPLMGFIVNPLAGVGGPVGLKGSDGDDIVREALRRGAVPVAQRKAAEALARLTALLPSLRVLAAGGAMGEDVASDAGALPRVVHRPHAAPSTRSDTISAAAAMADLGVDLILFAGGDGTARDMLAAVGDRVPVLGVPAGVKMHSAVFGTSPKNAGLLAASFLAQEPATRLRDAEVMDLDEDAIRADRVSARLFGYARSPYERRLLQNAKAGGGPGEDAALDATAMEIAAAMRPGRLYILGPGTTTRRVSDALGLRSTLLGVDAVLDGKLVGLDLGERELLSLTESREAYIIVGILGGQGSLFGRGNQQISAEVIRRTGRDRITVIASIEKLIALSGAPLRVDTGDADVDAMLSGHLHVETAPGRTTPVRVAA